MRKYGSNVYEFLRMARKSGDSGVTTSEAEQSRGLSYRWATKTAARLEEKGMLEAVRRISIYNDRNTKAIRARKRYAWAYRLTPKGRAELVRLKRKRGGA